MQTTSNVHLLKKWAPGITFVYGRKNVKKLNKLEWNCQDGEHHIDIMITSFLKALPCWFTSFSEHKCGRAVASLAQLCVSVWGCGGRYSSGSKIRQDTMLLISRVFAIALVLWDALQKLWSRGCKCIFCWMLSIQTEHIGRAECSLKLWHAEHFQPNRDQKLPLLYQQQARKANQHVRQAWPNSNWFVGKVPHQTQFGLWNSEPSLKP